MASVRQCPSLGLSRRKAKLATPATLGERARTLNPDGLHYDSELSAALSIAGCYAPLPFCT